MVYYNKDNKECKGCVINKTCMIESSYIDPKTNKVIRCPCIECIVKMICKGTSVCGEYIEYIDFYKTI